MTYNRIAFLFLSIIAVTSCSRTEKKGDSKRQIQNTNQELTTIANPTIAIDSLLPLNDSLTATKEITIVSQKKAIASNQKRIQNGVVIKADQTLKTSTPKNIPVPNTSYYPFKKMLSELKIGQKVTQKELRENYNLPEEGIKLIKSLQKTDNDQIAIEWKSTWMVEKLSDATFKNATLKVRFQDDKMYTSGNAIGIQYNKKTYNNLIIKEGSAYIPTVKGYHWKIGK